MAGRVDRTQPPGIRFVELSTDGHKRSIVAVLFGGTERFVDDREGAGAVFAGAFSDELLDPQAKRREPGRQGDRELVPAILDRGADERAQLEAGILVVLLPASFGHRLAG